MMPEAQQKEIVRHLTTQDDVLARIVTEVAWPEITSTYHVFHDLMSCVIEQQIHYRSTKKTFIKLLAKASLAELTIDNFEEFEEQALGNVKLSMRKYETITEAAELFRKYSLNWLEMNNAKVRETLGNIKGIGAWTVDMILLYTLERPNVFPAQDYHLRLVMEQLYDIGPKRIASDMEKVAEPWAPYQSYGVKYLLAWKEANKRQKL